MGTCPGRLPAPGRPSSTLGVKSRGLAHAADVRTWSQCITYSPLGERFMGAGEVQGEEEGEGAALSRGLDVMPARFGRYRAHVW